MLAMPAGMPAAPLGPSPRSHRAPTPSRLPAPPGAGRFCCARRRRGIVNQDLRKLQNRLRLRFNDASLLDQALVHRSYLNEAPVAGTLSNERLEFLGDAVLGLV